MACQSKTFINDLGSNVVAEVVNQLNTALSVTPMANLRQPTALAGTGAVDSTSVLLRSEFKWGSVCSS